MAEQLSYYTEKHQLLPQHHYGGRPARTTTDAMHMLTLRIKDTWRRKEVASVLFLDIEGTFPNAVNERLLHNKKRPQVPDKLGDLMSMILCQYYNTDILDIPNKGSESAIAYVDDAILVTTGKSFADMHDMLSDMMTREGGAIEWSNAHNSRFEFKLQKAKKSHETALALTPSKSAKYLGVYFNQHLTWGAQYNCALEKGMKWARQIRRAAAPSWGTTLKYARRLYISVAIPHILYAVDVWGSAEGRNQTNEKPDRISRRGNRAMGYGVSRIMALFPSVDFSLGSRDVLKDSIRLSCASILAVMLDSRRDMAPYTAASSATRPSFAAAMGTGMGSASMTGASGTGVGRGPWWAAQPARREQLTAVAHWGCEPAWVGGSPFTSPALENRPKKKKKKKKRVGRVRMGGGMVMRKGKDGKRQGKRASYGDLQK
ncbi:hypothetical protein EDB92DRAFT_1822288 [Lactarius akahatsu]|uniref:Reverse transcriptase domain-containing protein n=1 Tax=Lactarius akahatsu TaxID=416441 RepID=A0AAD4Q4R0_9AGAM|nr:hypothetical protein EDB92DRAFT_1822288 [Lactarius akahatsu]